MTGESDLGKILKSLSPQLHEGEYVFCKVDNLSQLNLNDIICFFRESEALTIVLSKASADQLALDYSFIASWITLEVHSSLSAVGLTAAFSSALSKENISCNVIAAYYHDHIFVAKADADKAMAILKRLSEIS